MLESMGKIDDALRAQRDALDLARTASDFGGRHEMGRVVARLERKTGLYAEAQRRLKGLIGDATGSPFHLVRLYTEAVRTAIAAEDPRTARSMLAKIEGQMTLLQEVPQAAELALVQGLFHDHLVPDRAKAIACYRSGLEKAGDATWHAYAVRLAILLLATRAPKPARIAEAGSLLDDAIALCERLLDPAPARAAMKTTTRRAIASPWPTWPAATPMRP